MRILTKSTKPLILTANETAWNSAYVRARGTPDEKRAERWRNPQIKQALNRETDQMCTYCESRIDHITYGHVEHIEPKSLRPEISHTWENLTWACPVCNVNKGDAGDILNPYQDELGIYIFFFGTMLFWRPGSLKGEVTVRRLDLNRIALQKARIARVEAIKPLLDRWSGADDRLKPVLEHAIIHDVRSGEYPSVAVQLLDSHGFPTSSLIDLRICDQFNNE